MFLDQLPQIPKVNDLVVRLLKQIRDYETEHSVKPPALEVTKDELRELQSRFWPHCPPQASTFDGIPLVVVRHKHTALPYMGPRAETKPERKAPYAVGTGCKHTKAQIPPEWAE